jgi:hypothetical protein
MSSELDKLLRPSLDGLVIVLMVVFVVFKIPVPEVIAKYVENIVGTSIIVLVVIYLLATRPLMGIVSIIAAYELIQRSRKSKSDAIFSTYLPTEASKAKELKSYNVFPTTLEEEVVHKMVPYVTAENLPAPSFRPVLNKTYDAGTV